MLFNFNLSAWFWWKPKNNIDDRKKVYAKHKIPNILVLDSGSKASVRIVDGQTEYEIASYFCKILQMLLQDSGWKVLLSKSHDNVSNIQVASWANTIDTKLFININFYQTYHSKPEIDIYYTAYNMTTDFWTSVDTQLSFLACDNIYKKYIKQSRIYAVKLAEYINCSEAIGMPLKNSIGINCPSITIDIGIANKGCLESILNPLASGITFLANVEV